VTLIKPMWHKLQPVKGCHLARRWKNDRNTTKYLLNTHVMLRSYPKINLIHSRRFYESVSVPQKFSNLISGYIILDVSWLLHSRGPQWLRTTFSGPRLEKLVHHYTTTVY